MKNDRSARMFGRSRFAAGMVAMFLALPVAAFARPTYFDVVTQRYAIAPDSRLDVCAVCHLRWDGTGPRNPFGLSVQQQLYIGKTIDQSLADVESLDSDGDGFSNVEELTNYLTLPGFSCANFFEVVGAPAGFDTYAVPLVPTCLEPIDMRISVTALAFVTDVGKSDSVGLEIFNNGSEHPLTISSYQLLGGSSADFSVVGPAAPFDIPLGSSTVIEVVFTPPAATFATGTLRITSNDPDPDEALIDLPLTAFASVHLVAPPSDRAACLGKTAKRVGRYGRSHLSEWGRCFIDSIDGKACNEGLREVRLTKARNKLIASLGGNRDRHCAGKALTPSLLDLPGSCASSLAADDDVQPGGHCADIALSNLGSLADCLVCRQQEASAAVLKAAAGVQFPDSPQAPALATDARCLRRMISVMRRTFAKVYKARSLCEATNITAASPVDCEAALATKLSRLAARLDARGADCAQSTGLAGCLFPVAEDDGHGDHVHQPPPADPACLSSAALLQAGDLVEAVFGPAAD